MPRLEYNIRDVFVAFYWHMLSLQWEEITMFFTRFLNLLKIEWTSLEVWDVICQEFSLAWISYLDSITENLYCFDDDYPNQSYFYDWQAFYDILDLLDKLDWYETTVWFDIMDKIHSKFECIDTVIIEAMLESLQNNNFLDDTFIPLSI